MPASTPIVFVSSTAQDLKVYREQVRETILALGLAPRMQEYFPASGSHPPYDKCMELVGGSDVVVVVIAHRYGWVPPDQPEKGDKSITWLECLKASEDEDKEILAFVIDETLDWPLELKEEYALNEAMWKGKATAKLLGEVQDRIEHLKNFKEWVDVKGIRSEFTTPESLRAKVAEALHDWITRHHSSLVLNANSGDLRKYLKFLRERTGYIDIRGLQVGSGKPHRFPIDQLYIPLTTLNRQSDELKSKKRNEREALDAGSKLRREHVPLQEALSERLLVVIGDPGSGKTTFLKRVAFSLIQSQTGEKSDSGPIDLGLDEPLFPLMISVEGLTRFIRTGGGKEHPSKASNRLATYLEKTDAGDHAGLSAKWFQNRLKEGQCLAMLDGLDEASDRVEREAVSGLIANLAVTFAQCRFVVTTRPGAYLGDAILPGFSEVRIADLPNRAIEEFLRHWCDAIHIDAPSEAKAHRRELIDALRSQAEIRRLARNPVMLTALAVVHWNEKRIPEQRAELYESIITWLSRARERRPGRLASDRCVEILQELALTIQNNASGRQIQIGRRDAAERIADELALVSGGDPMEVPRQKIQRAERFLAEEELDSGIVVKRGNDIRFWHLTFQEYLTARAVAGRGRPNNDRSCGNDRRRSISLNGAK